MAMQSGIEYLTKNKHQELTAELESLRTVKRKEVAEHLEQAKSLGDLSENAEYQEAREEQAKIEARINQLENILKTAIIVSHKKGDTVEVGSTVTIQKSKDSVKHTYEVVGSEEADMSAGKISYLSPLGSAMIGKKTGELFSFDTPKGKVDYKIISVE